MTLPCYYLPPISWFAAAKGNEPISLEVCENFTKQTCRNRCYIDSPNGKLALSIPIDRSNFNENGKCLMKDIVISHQLDWRHQHWYALETSYYNSPFFEYLQDDFRPIYNKEWKYLVDLNETLTFKCLELLEMDNSMARTASFEGAAATPTDLQQKPYYQVFSEKHGFIENLSIVDLIFNMGPEAGLFL
jgi:hypothetical protein